ncbi:hypothetical protein [Bradyrhizobium archetypum]|uniref:DUF4175 domain-containing protein n=1 Tax=Bradyrhizobium archetypum TaxID=2721160 RepID=A0A7Y4H5P7_9BRAD|nr:hypothetical protein [Bradyrhizobium archetypum]NOJ48144.1 hypothetical protein [Bradyrhizobium archetypum]
MTDARKLRSSGNWRTVYGGPLLIGVLSVVGLLSALLYEGPGRYFSWLALGAPIALTGWFYARRKRA